MCTLGVGIIGIHAHVQKNVMSDPECVPPEIGRPKSKTATSMGLRESAKYLAASPYIRNLAMLVIAYGMSINIVEVTWKGNLKRAFPDPNAYSAFMGNFSTATGSVTLVMMILGRFIFQRFGWTTAALVTPTVLALTGAFFFSLILFEGPFAPLLSYFGTTPLMAAVLIGAAQVMIFFFPVVGVAFFLCVPLARSLKACLFRGRTPQVVVAVVFFMRGWRLSPISWYVTCWMHVRCFCFVSRDA